MKSSISSKKGGFTFLEMLIVIMIISILFVAFRSSFQVKDKDILYGQTCIENTYGQVNNFLHAGLSSKSIYSGNIQIFPDKYAITFSPLSQKILLQYTLQNDTYIYSNIDLSGAAPQYCKSTTYTTQMSGEDYTLYINKGLQENADMKTLYITGTNSISTGETIFLQCNTSSTGCKTIARLETDTRIISIKKQICLMLSSTGVCLERDN